MDQKYGHGFIDSQIKGIEIFRTIDVEAPLIVCEAVWQYSSHVLPGLYKHRGPILTLANWSGEHPGLVGMLNLNASLTKAGVPYSTIWSEDFTDDFAVNALKEWLEKGSITHSLEHVRPVDSALAFFPQYKEDCDKGAALAIELREKQAVLGVFDEGCMGMFNAIVPDHLLFKLGIFKVFEQCLLVVLLRLKCCFVC